MVRSKNPTVREALAANPTLAAEYSNANPPETLNLTIGSKATALWHCSVYNCDYQMVIGRKFKKPDACSVCNGSAVFPGHNDLATTHPDLAAEWDYSKNELTPEQVKHSSGKTFFFICPACHHSYSTSLYNRTGLGTGCARCGFVEGQKKRRGDDLGVLDLEDDMASMFAGEGNPVRRGVKPTWWRCKQGHEWRQPPKDFEGCPVCQGQAVVSGEGKVVYPADNPISGSPEMMGLYAPSNELPAQYVSVSSAQVLKFCCPSGHHWEAPAYSVKSATDGGTSGCPHCTHQVSAKEEELRGFIEELVGSENLVTNTRSVIAPYELDIFLPNHGVAVEFNGLYWHREEKVGRKYHADKAAACAAQGIQLIMVWEDDWDFRREAVRSMLAHKLGVSGRRRVYARGTVVRELGAGEARVFCERHHVQGFVQGSVYWGLVDEGSGEIVAVSIWRKHATTTYLERYCTSATVIGGLGKLLKTAQQWAREQGVSRIVTFSDKSVSDGGLYQALGFTKVGELRPDYSYIVEGVRRHKFNYRISRFRKDPTLLYRDGLTETELAQLNNLHRVYDCGKTRWELPVQ